MTHVTVFDFSNVNSIIHLAVKARWAVLDRSGANALDRKPYLVVAFPGGKGPPARCAVDEPAVPVHGNTSGRTPEKCANNPNEYGRLPPDANDHWFEPAFCLTPWPWLHRRNSWNN
jgi:hypothetical protein